MMPRTVTPRLTRCCPRCQRIYLARTFSVWPGAGEVCQWCALELAAKVADGGEVEQGDEQ